MMSPRQLFLASALLGVCIVLAHGGRLTVPRSEDGVLRGARAAVHEQLEGLESLLPAGGTANDGLWRSYLAVVDKELERGHVDAAVRVWQDAYGAALSSRSWESMIAVGDAFVAIGQAAGTPRGARMNAREAYLSALIRARRERSVEGALRSAEAFEALDDRAVVEQCLHIAAQLAAGNTESQERVREARQRWASRQVAPES
jgi:hypothetical protein